VFIGVGLDRERLNTDLSTGLVVTHEATAG
jgi:hypothetical protein